MSKFLTDFNTSITYGGGLMKVKKVKERIYFFIRGVDWFIDRNNHRNIYDQASAA